MKIDTITIENFKSIKLLDNFKLGKINILIGSNGVGKSNFISFLTFLKNIANKNLQNYVANKAGANNFLHFGRKKSSYIKSTITFNSGNAYSIELQPDSEDAFYFSKEIASFYSSKWHRYPILQKGYKESLLDNLIYKYNAIKHYNGIPSYVKKALSGFEIYHFHDTSDNSPMKATCDVNDNRFLRKDGKNIAAFLLYLSEKFPLEFKKIQNIIRQVAPFFDSFKLAPLLRTPDKIRLEWLEKGNDEYFNADQLSDGTLRMIALATLLLQPEPPDTIIIDEPELGLHPAAINLLAEMIQQASFHSQIIISTQSVTLVNQFVPEDLIVVDRINGISEFKRLTTDQVSHWLEDYSLGEAWEKNIIGGRP